MVGGRVVGGWGFWRGEGGATAAIPVPKSITHDNTASMLPPTPPPCPPLVPPPSDVLRQTLPNQTRFSLTIPNPHHPQPNQTTTPDQTRFASAPDHNISRLNCQTRPNHIHPHSITRLTNPTRPDNIRLDPTNPDVPELSLPTLTPC